MKETYTFKTADGKYILTAKGEFLQRCEKPEEYTIYDLMTKYKLNQYLHNPVGPAITRVRDNFSEYWLNGNHATKEESEKMEHNHDFNNKLIAELSDETKS